MTGPEFSDQFDVLYNNIASNQAPGLNEYEKCVFLTKAQDEIIKNYFLPQSNPKQAGFDGNQKRQMDFSRLMFYETKTSSNKEIDDPLYDVRTPNKSVYLTEDLWIVVNERVTVTRNNKNVDLTVKPIAFDEYDRLMSKPYKRPLKYQAWRLILSDPSTTGNSRNVDLIVGPTDKITSYSIRYIKRPHPIIVGSLDGQTINNYCFEGDKNAYSLDSSVQEVSANAPCELDDILHEEILQRAVELAKIAWTSTGQDNAQMVVQTGQRSE